MFRKRDKIVYPRHGAGKIVDKYEVNFNGEKKDYYKIEFYNSPVDISVPIDNAQEIGMRYPLSKHALRKVLKKLGRRVKITGDVMKKLDEICKENLLSGRIEDAIRLVNLLRSLSEKKKNESKNFSYSASQRLETALDFIKSEVELVLGEGALNRYHLTLEEKR